MAKKFCSLTLVPYNYLVNNEKPEETLIYLQQSFVCKKNYSFTLVLFVLKVSDRYVKYNRSCTIWLETDEVRVD